MVRNCLFIATIIANYILETSNSAYLIIFAIILCPCNVDNVFSMFLKRWIFALEQEGIESPTHPQCCVPCSRERYR